MSPSQVLEQIRRVRIAQWQAQTELAALSDYAVGLGIGWPEIADWLGVTRQTARKHYQRRHREDANRRDRGPDRSSA
jgi:predicted transcriptional regulator